MEDPDRRRRSRSGRVLDALIWATPVGAASGVVLGDGVDAVGARAGAVIGAALYAPAEAQPAQRLGEDLQPRLALHERPAPDLTDYDQLLGGTRSRGEGRRMAVWARSGLTRRARRR